MQTRHPTTRVRVFGRCVCGYLILSCFLKEDIKMYSGARMPLGMCTIFFFLSAINPKGDNK